MATTALTLYKDTTNTEEFTLATVLGKTTTYDGAGSTPTFPIQMDLTLDRKPVGNASNDRVYINVHRSGAASAQGAIRTSGTELKVTVAKDPSSGAALLAEAEIAFIELMSYITGAAPTSLMLANIARIVRGQWL